MPRMSDSALETLLAEPFGGEAGSVMPPIFQSSLFTFDNYQDFEDRMAGRSDRALYTRVQNPTVAAFEGMMAKAEGGAAAIRSTRAALSFLACCARYSTMSFRRSSVVRSSILSVGQLRF